MSIHPEQLLINEVQLLLAEQRTYYAMLRTGIAVFTLPLTILGFLVVTRDSHGVFNNIWLAASVILLLIAISFLGIWLSKRSESKIKHIHKLINRIRQENKRLAELIL